MGDRGLRGFASMSLARRREISSMGGKRAQELGTAYRWDAERAARAGRIGGSVKRERKKRKEENHAD